MSEQPLHNDDDNDDDQVDWQALQEALAACDLHESRDDSASAPLVKNKQPAISFRRLCREQRFDELIEYLDQPTLYNLDAWLHQEEEDKKKKKKKRKKKVVKKVKKEDNDNASFSPATRRSSAATRLPRLPSRPRSLLRAAETSPLHAATAADNNNSITTTETPLHVLLQHQPTAAAVDKVIHFLTTRHTIPEDAVDKHGRTPLHVATVTGCSLAVTQRLLQGVSVVMPACTKDMWGRHALHWAAVRAGMLKTAKKTKAKKKKTLRSMLSRGVDRKSSMHSAFSVMSLSSTRKASKKSKDEAEGGGRRRRRASLHKVPSTRSTDSAAEDHKTAPAPSVPHLEQGADEAASHLNSLLVIQLLVATYPEALEIADSCGHTPVQLAESHGADESIQTFMNERLQQLQRIRSAPKIPKPTTRRPSSKQQQLTATTGSSATEPRQVEHAAAPVPTEFYPTEFFNHFDDDHDDVSTLGQSIVRRKKAASKKKQQPLVKQQQPKKKKNDGSWTMNIQRLEEQIEL